MPKYDNRKSAIAAGASKYWTIEQPTCSKGHYSYRWTLNGACVECQTERRKAEAAKYKAAKSAAVSVRSSTPGAPAPTKAQDRRSFLEEQFNQLNERF